MTVVEILLAGPGLPVVLPRGYTEGPRIDCNRVFIRFEEHELLARVEEAAAEAPL